MGFGESVKLKEEFQFIFRLWLSQKGPDFMENILWRPGFFANFFLLEFTFTAGRLLLSWSGLIFSVFGRDKVGIVWQISSVLFVIRINDQDEWKGRGREWSQCCMTLLSSLGTHLCVTCRRGMPSSAWTRWRERSFFLRAPKWKFLHISCKIKTPRINTSISKAKLYCELKRVKSLSGGSKEWCEKGGDVPFCLNGSLIRQNINVIAGAGKSSAWMIFKPSDKKKKKKNLQKNCRVCFPVKPDQDTKFPRHRINDIHHFEDLNSWEK